MNDNFWNIYNQISETGDKKKENTNNTENTEICNNCKTDSIINYEGSFLCEKCGFVKCKDLSSEQEWRFYGESDNKSRNPARVGMPTNYLLPQSSIGSLISKSHYYTDYSTFKMRRYHQWNAMPYKERSLYAIFSKLNNICDKYGIPKIIIEDAKKMYKTLSETKISRGINRKGLEAACIYIACRLRDVPRSAKEIAEIFGLKISEMTKGCKKFKEIMNLTNFNKKNKIKATGPLDFIGRYCSKLNLDNEIIEICCHVAKKAEKLELVDENTPSSIAAGSIFLVIMILGLPYTKNNVSEKSSVSNITIAKVYKKIYQFRSYLFPENINEKYDINLY